VPLTLGGEPWNDFILEAWVGTGCEVDATRAASCWKAQAKPIAPDATSYTAHVRAQDVVSQAGATQKSGYVAGTEQACRTQQTSPSAIGVDLYFIWETSGGAAVPNALVKTPAPIDTLAASPPAWKDIGIGESLLKLSWAPLTDSDTIAYRVFLSPHRGNEPAAPPDASACVSPFPEPTDGGAAPVDASLFDFQDFQGASTAGGTITGLVDGVPYAIAIAALDRVGNVGALSTSRCAPPEATADFWDRYRAAGGSAGGSCAIGTSGAAAPALLALALLLVARLVRSRSSR
jgi:hypothetical protein